MTALSIVIPCFRDADVLKRNLPLLQARLRERHIDHEIIVVDDGSDQADETQKITDLLGCRFASNPHNMGKGAAVRRGMLEAVGDFRIFTDVDIPFELDAFERFVHYLDFKEFDVVVGDRTLPESSYLESVPPLRRLGSTVFSTIVGRFVAGGHFDTQCGMKGFRAGAAEDLFRVARIDRFAFDVELLYISLKRNYDIKKLPVVLRCQEGSSVNVVRDGLQMLGDLFRIRMHEALGRYRRPSPAAKYPRGT